MKRAELIIEKIELLKRDITSLIEVQLEYPERIIVNRILDLSEKVTTLLQDLKGLRRTLCEKREISRQDLDKLNSYIYNFNIYDKPQK